MKCHQCGAELAAGCKFCNKCGAKTEAPLRVAGAEQVWFVHVGGDAKGPFTVAAVQNMLGTGKIDGSTPVWKEGMAAWSTAGAIPEIGGAAGAPQPAEPAGAPADSQAELRRKDAEARARIKQMVEEEKQKKRRGKLPSSGAGQSGGGKPLLGGDPTSTPITENIVFIIIMLFFCCWPAGLYFLWTSSKISQQTKLILTLVWVVLNVISAALFGNAFRQMTQSMMG